MKLPKLFLLLFLACASAYAAAAPVATYTFANPCQPYAAISPVPMKVKTAVGEPAFARFIKE